MTNGTTNILREDDVISVTTESRDYLLRMMLGTTFLSSDFCDAVIRTYKLEKLAEQGIDCSVLQPEKKWQTGRFKVKVSIAFYPDENEEEAEADESETDAELEYRSPLDEIREMMSSREV